ncbi:hypothetical protein GCM10011585_36190 [Edaphobacter dinghuensis]|uniref:Uncharacterized protein n=1 Tax=Edaphobacter dinghuensis TaxID=1560005 RepID=A0A917HSC9_9BACT|nr:hypothetical protein GCM10011585_36190 [Edaphobacter dinghuensis]
MWIFLKCCEASRTDLRGEWNTAASMAPAGERTSTEAVAAIDEIGV